MDELSEEQAAKFLKARGYIVKKNKPTVKRTFDVDPDTYKEFRALQTSLKIRVKDAIQFALSDWVKKNKPR